MSRSRKLRSRLHPCRVVIAQARLESGYGYRMQLKMMLERTKCDFIALARTRALNPSRENNLLVLSVSDPLPDF